MRLRYSLGDDDRDTWVQTFWDDLGECEIDICPGISLPHPQNFPHEAAFAEVLEECLLVNWDKAIDLGRAASFITIDVGDLFCNPHLGDLFLMWHGTKEPAVIAPYLQELAHAD